MASALAKIEINDGMTVCQNIIKESQTNAVGNCEGIYNYSGIVRPNITVKLA